MQYVFTSEGNMIETLCNFFDILDQINQADNLQKTIPFKKINLIAKLDCSLIYFVFYQWL